VTIDPSVSRYVIIGVAALGVATLAAVVFAPAGCGANGGPSDYDRMVAARQGAADSAASQGAKYTLKKYPLGEAYAVSLKGMTVTDDLLRQIQTMGKVSELDLSGSTVTDDQLGLISDTGLGAFLFKLDLSNTGVTDAGIAKLGGGGLFLAEVNLVGTKVTPAAVAEFKRKRQASPNARIKNTTVKLK
jgi:hypothetical protein